MFATYLRGRANYLKGKCFEGIGENGKALELYYDACGIFKISFPKKL
jgi:hypothetical protein